IEIVSEPDMRTPEQAIAYLKELRAILVFLGVCDGNMEEGSFRCDANCSVRKKGDPNLGVKVEIKNINSFKFIKDAIHFEFRRQVAAVEMGQPIVQETRLWREGSSRTESMRRKEGSDDYRYFPDPDLPPLIASPEWVETIRAELPELPAAKRARYQTEWDIPAQIAETLTSSRAVAEFFEAAVEAHDNPAGLANWMTNEVLAVVSSDQALADLSFTPSQLGELVRLIDEGQITGKIAKQVFSLMLESGDAPSHLVDTHGLRVMSDTGELESIIEKIIADNPDQAEQYRAGKTKVVGYFVGQIMKATRGKADPQQVNELLREKLNA
ncbi:MAG: Asp-tRNA(Asn)/Glu-tRNA(Gln) amidotransferase subunit GatB, partial [Myxococcales bacterium]|nr:Asp-tRNA(Asn)/Glu-tRNA(Gln) amidotransferase subunit GatB [Myxococcales bacterium]